jgi:hypothetical protein
LLDLRERLGIAPARGEVLRETGDVIRVVVEDGDAAARSRP